MVTPNRLHCAAHSRFQGSLAAPPNGAIRPVQPQPVAHSTRSARQSTATVSPSQSVAIVVPTFPQLGHTAPSGSQARGAGRWPRGGRCRGRRRPVEGGADVRVHLPGRVDVAHPVVAVGLDAEAREGVDEDPREVSGVRGVAIAGRVGHVGERTAHLALDRIRRQQRLRVHRVQVVDAVQELRLEAAGAQRPGDHVEDDRPAEAADVDGPGRRLRVVDDLRSLDTRRQLVSPVHRFAPIRRRRCRRMAAWRLRFPRHARRSALARVLGAALPAAASDA